MPHIQQASRPVVVHLISGASQLGPQFDQVIAQAGALPEHTDNVYDALAGLLRSDRPDEPSALLVCFDLVDQTEMEFFSLVRQHLPSLAVYLYSHAEDRSALEQIAEQFAAQVVAPHQLGPLLDGRIGKPQPATAVLEVPEAPRPAEPQQPAAPPAEPPPQRPSRQPPPPAATPTADQFSGGLLTPEELDALLAPDDGRSADPREQR
jgi:hypothetical protein